MNKELSANTTLSHYRIVSRIGAGGMGEVWLAEDTRLGRKVALKVLPAEFTEDPERVRRFTQEAKAASALNHPNIISVYDIGECDTGRFIVMEFVAGRTLRSVIAKDNSLETLFTLGGQMGRALSAAHAAGITHRDIKPDNIMVRDDGYVKMLDFGLARLLPTTASDPEAMTLAQQTTPGTVMGTLAYMSPEQASGKTAGSASDVFALGIVLYELATGRHPFKSETMIGYLHAITSQVPPSMTSLKSHLPAALDDLILRMLEKDANQRPTASEVAQALQEIEKYGSSNTLPIRVVADKSKAPREEEGFWVAVLPFKYRGSNLDLEALAEGLPEDIVTGLSRFSYLRVIARGSTLRYANQTTDLRMVGKELGARYVMEGSLRQAGTKLRLAVQLVDAATGAHLWAENYEREFSPENIFELQDDLVPRIVSTVADWYGALPHSMSESVRLKPPNQLSPYEALLRSFGYFENIASEEHAIVRSSLERAVEQEPANADGWAMLSMIFGEEHRFGFNVEPDSLGRSLKAARRAVEIAHANHFAWLALAQALFFRKEFDPFRDAAERAIALNPMDGSTVEYLGHLIAFSGNWERGCELAERARQLNPNHPSWYWSVPFLDAYRKGDYRSARPFLLKGNPQKNWLMHALLAAVQGQLGESEAAARHLREVLTMMPDFALIGRDEFSKWYLPELVDHLMDGLRKAGLEIADESQLSKSSPSLVSIETRTDEGFWVAVLPFKATGTNVELSTLAEGLSDEIVTGLNRFSYLRVIARSSTLRYSGQTSDVRSVGKALGARYVMEGNVRQAGSLIRVTVQLVDATTGAHLWAETYDRPFKPDEIFALQDDLVPRIVSTVADQHGVLPHSMSEVVRAQDPDQLTAYETLLRGFRYYEGVSASEHATIRASLERALETSPGSADCWAMLSIMYCDEHKFGFNQLPDSLGRAVTAAQRGVEISPTNPFAYEALAQALFFRKEFDSFRNAAERAIALNPMDGATNAFMGILIAFTGDWDYGCAVAERATQLNPHHPGWYWNAAFYNAYRKRDYEAALKITLEFHMPGLFYHHVNRAAVYAQLGDREAASRALGELLVLKPDFAISARKELGKWLQPEFVDHVMEGLRKAGLEITEAETSKTTSSVHSSMSRADEGFWIAVLPFKFPGSNTEVATLAEGLSEEIVTGLARFSYLRVISRSSTLRYASETDDVRAVGKTLGARYVMEGSLRLAGSSLRMSVQLVDSSTGANLWAETYNRQFRAEEIFAIQDDLVPRIVSTVADINGVLPRSMSEAVCSRNPDELSPYEAVLRSFRYFDRVTPQELTSARSCLELAIEKAPTYADALAMLAILCVQDYAQGFNLQSDSLKSGTTAAQRAVEAGPSNHLAYFSLAQVRFFQKDFQSFRNAAERAVALNPMDGNSLAFMGELLTYVGDWERGLALASRAKEINPHHPGWFWYADFFHAYRQGDYRGALDLILKTNLPGHWGMHTGIAASAGQLGERETATKAVRDLLKLKPDFRATIHDTLAKWFDPELRGHLIDGLRKAGLEIVGEGPGVHHVSSESRADEGFWIAVLPFKVVGPSTELETLALGMTEEIVTGFSRFSYLRVMALGSTMKHSQSGDLRQIGAELGARYVMEGSIRQAGSTVRLAVQLVDASTGAHLWAETFDRHFQPDQIFAMQDELIPRIVSTCADHFGVLARSISDAIRRKESSQLSPYEALMRGFGYHYRLNPQEHAEARDILEKAVKEAPNNADCWAMLSWVYSHEYGHGFNTQPGSLDRALAAARRAVDLAPTNHLAYQTLAVALFFRKERANCLSAAERAIALNPLDASNEAIFLITFVDDWERGCSLIRRAMDLNPYVPGWYRLILALNEYRKGNYREAVAESVKANVPGIWTDIVLSAAYAQLGEQAGARNALSKLLAENSVESAHEMLTKWFDADLVDNLVEGLRKAGLEIAADKSTTSSTAKSEATSATTGSDDEARGETNSTPSIAVLPFVNISNERENEYFCDGLAEELLNALSKIESLHVAARTSAFSFKGKQTDVREIGSTLSVSTVLEGSVRRSGNRVRISVQLVNVADGYHLWSEKYDRKLEDIFDIQDEISLAIVAALKVKLVGAEQKVVKRYTENTEAYQLYLKGRFFVNQRTSESLLKAIEYFNKTIALDANYALGYAGLADAYLVLGVPDAVTEALSPRDSLPNARAAAEKALQLDTSGGEVYAALAHIKWKERDWAGAESDYKRSIELNPNNPIAHFYYAVYLASLGRHDEAVKEINRAQELDPLSLPVNASVTYVLYFGRQYDEAIAVGKRTLELDSAFPLTHQRLGLPYVQKQMYPEAIAEFQQAVNNSNRAPQPMISLGHAYAVSGNKVEAEKVLAELKDLSRARYVSPYGVAVIYVGLGDKGQAFQWLESAYDERNTELTFLQVDPRLDPLRDDAHFEALLKKVAFPH